MQEELFMTTISVQRALMELKTLNGRIEKAARKPFIAHKVGDEGKPTGFQSVEAFKEEAKANLQSVDALIKRRNALKHAVIASNAVTDVVVADVKMKVAEAIDRKDSIDFENYVLNNLKGQFENVTRSYEGDLNLLNQRIDKRIADIAGREKKIDPQEEQEIVASQKKRYQPEIIDPIGLKKEIDKREKEIEAFRMEVDIALSEINARTEIEIAD